MNERGRDAAGPSGLLASLRRLVATLLELAQVRLELIGTELEANIAAGSGIAIVGIILAAVTKGAVLDVTGGILTTVGLLFAGATAVMKRGQILEAFRKEIMKGRTQLENEVTERLQNYIRSIKHKIDLNFSEFDNLLDTEQKQISDLEARHIDIQSRVRLLQQELVN